MPLTRGMNGDLADNTGGANPMTIKWSASETNGGDTFGVEAAQTITQERASGVAVEIRRLGEEAFALGENLRREAERFAQEEIKVVADMEAHLRKGLSRLRHIEQTMQMARSARPDPTPQVEHHGEESQSQEEGTV